MILKKLNLNWFQLKLNDMNYKKFDEYISLLFFSFYVTRGLRTFFILKRFFSLLTKHWFGQNR